MTTSLITGLNFDQAVNVIRGVAIERAEACKGLGFHTEEGEKFVLIGVAQVGGYDFVMAVDRADYSGSKLANLLGFPNELPPTAAERVAQAKKAK